MWKKGIVQLTPLVFCLWPRGLKRGGTFLPTGCLLNSPESSLTVTLLAFGALRKFPSLHWFFHSWDLRSGEKEGIVRNKRWVLDFDHSNRRVGGWVLCVLLSHVWLFATPWTVACQARLSMGFSRQEYQSGLPFPFPNRCVVISYCYSNSLTTLRGQFSNKYVHIVVQPISRTFSSSELKLYTHQTTTFHFLFPLPIDNNHSTSF